MEPGMFRGLDKILYTVMLLILFAVGCNGYLIGRCNGEKGSQASSAQPSGSR